MDAIFKALADASRRSLLDRLQGQGGQTLGQLCEGLAMSRQAVSKHLKVLEDAGLVAVVWSGREKLHFLNPAPIGEVYDRWIGRYERHRVQALADLKRGLEALGAPSPTPHSEAPMSIPDFVYVTYISAAPQAVFDALTDPAFTRQYWGGRQLESTWEVGARVESRRPDGALDWEGEVLVFDPPTRLAYTFVSQLAREEGAPTEVEFALAPAGPSVRLTVTHSRLPSERAHAILSQGWPGILSGLKTLLETGQPLDTGWRG